MAGDGVNLDAIRGRAVPAALGIVFEKVAWKEVFLGAEKVELARKLAQRIFAAGGEACFPQALVAQGVNTRQERKPREEPDEPEPRLKAQGDANGGLVMRLGEPLVFFQRDQTGDQDPEPFPRGERSYHLRVFPSVAVDQPKKWDSLAIGDKPLRHLKYDDSSKGSAAEKIRSLGLMTAEDAEESGCHFLDRAEGGLATVEPLGLKSEEGLSL